MVLFFWTNGTIHEITRTKHKNRYHPKSTFEAKLISSIAIYDKSYFLSQSSAL